MHCELCNQRPATVHVTEIQHGDALAPTVVQKHMCETCAQPLELPSSPIVLAMPAPETWKKLIVQTAQRVRSESGPVCPNCGMSLAEFRSKGRFGCAQDYAVFRAHVEPLLLRVHNSATHVGRVPAATQGEIGLSQQLTELRSKLDAAIRAEAYENAARLRDEIQELEGHAKAR